MVATPVKDASKWLDKFLQNFYVLDFPEEKIRFAFVEGNSSDDTFDKLKIFQEAHDNVWLRKLDVSSESRFERLAASRNKMINEALEKENHVLCIDADIVYFHPNTLNLLLSHNVDVVAPLILIEGESRFYDTFAFVHEGKNFEHEIPYCPVCVNRQLFEVESVGTCYLVKREVFEADVRYGCEINEQVSFCSEARGKGFKIWVDPKIAVLHANLPEYGVPFH